MLLGWGQISLFNDVVINTGGSLIVDRLVVGFGGNLLYFWWNSNCWGFMQNLLQVSGGYMNGGSFTLKNLDYQNSSWYASGGTIYIDSPSGT